MKHIFQDKMIYLSKMPVMKPIVSIIIPTYNRAHLISRTIRSIISQSIENWECIIVDDHSTDDTKAVLENIADARIRVIDNERKKGAQGARNTGMFHAVSDWVFFFDSDNIMHNKLLESLSNCICDDVDVVSCFSRIVDVEKGDTGRVMKSINEGYIHDELFLGKCYVDFNHAIIRKSLLMVINGLDENCPSMQEWDTHIRLSKTAYYSTVPDALVDYYIGGKDAISTDCKREIVGRLYILRKHIKEWKKHDEGMIKFGYEIVRLINKSTDPKFRLMSYFRLFSCAPILLYHFSKGVVRPLYYKIFKAS